MRLPRWFVLIPMLVLIASPSWATDRYVDKNHVSPACSNSGAGTEAQPWCSLSYAVQRKSGTSIIAGAMASGDTVYVKNGTYNEIINITGPSGTAGAHTVIRNYPGHTPVFTGGGSSRMRITHGCSYIDVIGLTFDNYSQGLFLDDDEATDTACTNITLDGITISNTQQEGLALRGGPDPAPRNWVVKNSKIFNTGLNTSLNGEGVYTGHSSRTDYTNGVLLLNNRIYNNGSESIELKANTHDIIIDGNDVSNCITSPNTYGNTGGCIELNEGGIYGSNPNFIVRNNVVHDVTQNASMKRAIRVAHGATVYNNVIYNIASAYNCILSNSSNYPRLIYHNTVNCSTANAIVISNGATTSTNNIGPNTAGNVAYDAAFFTNAAGNNYHLVAGSAPANAGSDLRAVVPTDKDGAARDAQPDRGAYELVSGDITPPAAPAGLRVTTP